MDQQIEAAMVQVVLVGKHKNELVQAHVHSHSCTKRAKSRASISRALQPSKTLRYPLHPTGCGPLSSQDLTLAHSLLSLLRGVQTVMSTGVISPPHYGGPGIYVGTTKSCLFRYSDAFEACRWHSIGSQIRFSFKKGPSNSITMHSHNHH